MLKAHNEKKFNESNFESQFLQSLQRQNETSNKTLRVLVSFFQRLIAALLKNTN